MRRSFLRAAVLLSVALVIVFVVFLINQTAQLVELAARVSPTFGDAVLWGLVFILGACLIVPAVLLLRLPKPIAPPASEDSPEFQTHLERLRKRLRANPATKALPLNSREEIEAALTGLHRHSDRLIRGASSQVFLTTAISQNGSLDAILVLTAQTRLIWKVAHVYYQRPTLRDMAYLYANVASTAFIASTLEEIDIAEQVEPVIATTLGSVAAAVPGTALLVNSISTGAANAFLTLRVGIIAKNYCSALVLPPKGVLRRSAAVEAARLLGSVTSEGAKRVTRAFLKASAGRVGGMVTGVGGKVKETGSWVAGKFGRGQGGEEPEPA